VFEGQWIMSKEDEAPPTDRDSILLEFFDAVRKASTLAQINVAAGLAHKELLDLVNDCVDHLGDMF
jgi:hypothetical protein